MLYVCTCVYMHAQERITALLNYSDKVFSSQSTSRSADGLPSISSADMVRTYMHA